MALRGGIKISYILVSKREKNGREEKRGKGRRRRGRGEEEQAKPNLGMELHGILKFCMNFHVCIVISLFPKT